MHQAKLNPITSSEEDDYVQLWQIVKHSYEHLNQQIHQDGQFNHLDQQINKNNKNNLLLCAEQGKKSLLCAYYNHLLHTKNHIICMCFGSVTPVYSDILSSIVNQLRQKLHINQKIELNEEKLRRYFKYWLEIASKQLYHQEVGQTINNRKIIIIIEAIDLITDSKGNNLDPNFWIPSDLPQNVNIIMSALPHSLNKISTLNSYKHIFLQLATLTQNHIQAIIKQYPQLSQHHHIKTIIPQYIQLSYINHNEQDIKCILLSLIHCKKGLTKNQLKQITNCQEITVEEILIKFNCIITQFKGLYIIWNKHFKQIIQSKIDPLHYKTKKIHIKIGKILKKQPTSLRKLEELIYHLSYSDNYLELKEVISRVENFLMLYSPSTKHLLCCCWAKLQNLQHDPVYEYNRSVEGFLNHYYPTQEEIFKIIFQLSLFFKQYAQFENWRTPFFMHPPIRAQVQQLAQINIHKQLLEMNMVGKIKNKKKQSIINQSKISSKSQKINQQIKIQHNLQKIQNDQRFQSIIGLNVNIVSNQQKFKQFYMKTMKDYIKEYLKIGSQELKDKNLISDDQEDQDEQLQKIQDTNLKIQKIKEQIHLKDYQEYREQSYHRKRQQPSYYYYKQWLWLQFPWIGQSLNNNYSQLIKKCIESPTQYMSIDLQNTLFQQALKIAQIARENKLQIYKKTLTGNIRQNFSSIGRSKSNISCLVKANKSLLKKSLKPSKWENQLSSIINQCNSQRNYESTIFLTQQSKVTQIIPSRKVRRTHKRSELPHNKQNQLGEVSLQLCQQDSFKINRKYNSIKFENSNLLSHIQTIKSTLIMYQYALEAQNTTKLKQKLLEIQNKKTNTNSIYIIQTNLKQKLQTIKKICQLNKSHGSESDGLDDFLKSLIQMLQNQKNNNQLRNKKLQSILSIWKDRLKQYMNDKINLQKQISAEKYKMRLKTKVVIKAKTNGRQNIVPPPSRINAQQLKFKQKQKIKTNLLEIKQKFKEKYQKNIQLKMKIIEMKLRDNQSDQQLKVIKQKYKAKINQLSYNSKAKIKQKIIQSQQQLINIIRRKQILLQHLKQLNAV